MHMPMFGDTEMGRSGAPAVNVVHPEKSRRIDAMDEVKRALETAEEMPLRHLILHLGEREDRWSPRTLEHAMTAIEHLQAFSRPLGVKLLLENIQNEVTESANLVEIVSIGHFKDVGVCLDVGHAHIGGGIAAAIARVESAHPVCPYPRQPWAEGRASLARGRNHSLGGDHEGTAHSAAVVRRRAGNQLPARGVAGARRQPGRGNLQDARAVGGNARRKSEPSRGRSTGHHRNPQPARR